jgi:tetratricopeptide (TPR) repeat protein
LLLRSASTCLVVLLVGLAPVRRARACGPDFPPELLSHRARTLAELPDGAFLHEAARLVPKPADAFPVVESYEDPEGARTGGGARETEIYAAGATAFHAGHSDEARARFLEVLALPAEERRRFSTFAAFTLGREAESTQEARERFAEVRELVRQGFEDPLGLAVASLGEEARLLLREGDDVGAIQLYAEQAAHGSSSGATSLLFVVRAIARDEARLQRALKDPLGQRLLATYAWTRGQETLWSEDDSAPRPSPLPRLLEALASVPGLAGADRLAAGAWRAGRFDLAERFADKERTPLAAWVKAKLALRRGDRTAAERYLTEATEGFPETEVWESTSWPPPVRPRARVEGERALLALLRGDANEAAERALKSCAWPDIAYVAERVLTMEELQRFVAAHASERLCQPGSRDEETAPLRVQGTGEVEELQDKDMGAQLRLLLGRRLLRSGRGQESLEYFRGSKWEEPARKYVEALDRARSVWNDVDEAQALYSAALLARTLGMELMGTEVAPDWALVEGQFDLGGWYQEMQQATPEGSPERAAQEELALTSDAERARLTANAPPHALRFHYRSTAADLAEKAAERVPPRSQAYAALMCHAARFVARTDPERMQRIWRTYVKRGAYVPEVSMFGESCPEPDFERLRSQKLTMTWRGWQLRTLATVGGGMVLLPVMGAIFFVRRKRQDIERQRDRI